jgi:hypothetical protein
VNKENMKLFVAALLSDEYEQGRYRLTTIEGDSVRHCCLGVACEVALKNGVRMEIDVVPAPGHPGVTKRVYNGESLFLPVAVREWLGVDNDNLMIQGFSASTLNDDSHWTFEQIAEGIVQTYELEGEPE